MNKITILCTIIESYNISRCAIKDITFFFRILILTEPLRQFHILTRIKQFFIQHHIKIRLSQPMYEQSSINIPTLHWKKLPAFFLYNITRTMDHYSQTSDHYKVVRYAQLLPFMHIGVTRRSPTTGRVGARQ